MRPQLRDYWERRGRRYYREFRHKSGREKAPYDQQAAEFERAVSTLSPVHSVLELACGFGRVTQILRKVFPQAYILAVDLSTSQVKRARRLVRGVHFRVGDVTLMDLTRTFDLVIACEFYMHLPEDEFDIMVDKVAKWSRRFAMNIDFTGEEALSATESGVVYQFRHNYPQAYRRRSFHRVTEYPLPKQTLFVAEKGGPRENRAH